MHYQCGVYLKYYLCHLKGATIEPTLENISRVIIHTVVSVYVLSGHIQSTVCKYGRTVS